MVADEAGRQAHIMHSCLSLLLSQALIGAILLAVGRCYPVALTRGV